MVVYVEEKLEADPTGYGRTGRDRCTVYIESGLGNDERRTDSGVVYVKYICLILRVGPVIARDESGNRIVSEVDAHLLDLEVAIKP